MILKFIDFPYFCSVSKFSFLIKYIKYRFISKNEHSIHSPYLFRFYLDVIKDQTPFYVYEDIESIRSKLLMTDKEITIEDYGAGSKINNSNQRNIKNITKNAVKSKNMGNYCFD